MDTQTQDLPQTSTTSQEVAPHLDAAAQWRDVIERLQAYKLECDQLDTPPGERTYDEDLALSRRAYEVERGLDEMVRECRRLDSEAAAKPTKKR